MRAGLGLLRLSPQSFWTMTPRELAAALEGAFGRSFSAPLARGELTALIERFPDAG